VTPEQIVKALARYIAFFKERRVIPLRSIPGYTFPNANVASSHAHWMCHEAMKFALDDAPKASRWLCFIQGVMWCHCGCTIEEFKNDNRSEA
jgi:hypothetical protein